MQCRWEAEVCIQAGYVYDVSSRSKLVGCRIPRKRVVSRRVTRPFLGRKISEIEIV